VIKKKFAIYGCGGFGREVLPLLRSSTKDVNSSAEVDIIFVSDSIGDVGTYANGVLVCSFEQLTQDYSDHQVTICVGDAKARRNIATQCIQSGLSIAAVSAPTSRVLDGVSIGEGSVLCDFVTLTSNITIGRQFHANIYSYIAHDCIVGDYVTLAPKVCVNGNVIIEDDAYIGTGAIIKQGNTHTPLVIGKGAIIGMGSVVTKDVPSGAVVVGNPARVLKMRPEYEVAEATESQ